MPSFALLATRLLAVYFVSLSLTKGLPLLSMLEKEELEQLHKIAIFGHVVVPILVGIVLWVLAPPLARRFRSTPDERELDEEGLVSAGTFLIGIYLVVTHLGHLLGYAQSWVDQNIASSADAMVGEAVALVLGAALMLGPQGVTRLYFKIKYFRTK